MTPFDAHVFSRILVGQDVNGELGRVSAPLIRIAEHLAGKPKEQRRGAFDGYLCSLADHEAFVEAIANADPMGPAPESEEDDDEPASIADLRRVMSEISWNWDLWLPRARVAGIASFEGVGKTRFGLDLNGRICRHDPWPDGQAPTFPEGTPCLWLCADGHQDDIAEAAAAMDLPDESIRFCTSRGDPYGGTSIDDTETFERLDRYIPKIKPALVFIDTLTNATRRDLCRQNETKIVMGPLIEIAQRHQVTIVPFLHLAMDGQALGRRIKGVTRTLLHLDRPDPAHPERLKLWVEKSYAKKPPPLGLVMGDKGNVYSSEDIPRSVEKPRGGRPSEARDKARQFIVETLTKQNDRKTTDLCAAFVASGGSDKTFWRARDAMVKEGELVCDGTPQLSHLQDPEGAGGDDA